MTISSHLSLGESIASLLEREPDLAQVFISQGMACVGCSMARFERLGNALAIYGLETSGFLAELEANRQSRRPHVDLPTITRGENL